MQLTTLVAVADEQSCINCKHYMLHYITIDGKVCEPCNCGHCKYPRLKIRKPEDSCGNFERR